MFILIFSLEPARASIIFNNITSLLKIFSSLPPDILALFKELLMIFQEGEMVEIRIPNTLMTKRNGSEV
jgi:hypothetical protein